MLLHLSPRAGNIYIRTYSQTFRPANLSTSSRVSGWFVDGGFRPKLSQRTPNKAGSRFKVSYYSFKSCDALVHTKCHRSSGRGFHHDKKNNEERLSSSSSSIRNEVINYLYAPGKVNVANSEPALRPTHLISRVLGDQSRPAVLPGISIQFPLRHTQSAQSPTHNVSSEIARDSL